MDSNDIKIDSSPTGTHRFTFSRTSSTGSAAGGCTSSASSAHNTGGHICTDQTSPTSTKTPRKMTTRQSVGGACPKRVIVKQRTVHTQTPARFCKPNKAKRILVGRVRAASVCFNSNLQERTVEAGAPYSGYFPTKSLSVMESVTGYSGEVTECISNGIQKRSVETQTPHLEPEPQGCMTKKASKCVKKHVRFELQSTSFEVLVPGSRSLPNASVANEALVGTSQRSFEDQASCANSLSTSVTNVTSWDTMLMQDLGLWPNAYLASDSPGSSVDPVNSSVHEKKDENLILYLEPWPNTSSTTEASFDDSSIALEQINCEDLVPFLGSWPSTPSATGASIDDSSNATEHLSYSEQKRTDDEDSDSSKAISYKDRRREAHTVAEQKRRDAIKKGYDELLQIVPTCHQQESLSSQKMSKATVLQRSIDYMQFLSQQKSKQEEELDSLRKEVMALKIMKANYEHIVKTHQNAPAHGQNQVSDEVKFQVFQQIMDALFHSFNSSISVANFAELSACVFSWLEEYCKPQALREAVMTILTQLNSQLTSSQ